MGTMSLVPRVKISKSFKDSSGRNDGNYDNVETIEMAGACQWMDDSHIPKTDFSVKLVMALGIKDANCCNVMIIVKVT